MASRQPPVRFGPFELDYRAAQLRRGPVVLNLTGQPYRMLELLVERAGELVTREEICRKLWPEGHNVDFEAAINVAARRIREVLRESADSPTYLHTVRGRGYRFELPPQPVETPPEVPLPPDSVHEEAPPEKTASVQRPKRIPWVRGGAVLAGVLILVIGVIGRSGHNSGERSIYQFSHSGSVSDCAVSRDGQHIAYVDDDDNEPVLRICDSSSGGCSVLLRHPGALLKLLFSADGQYLLFGSDDGPSPGANIYRVRSSGGPPNAVVRGSAWLQAISADGQRILYFRDSEREDTLYVADLNGGPERRVLHRYRPDRITAAALSPDGTTVSAWWLVANNLEFHYSLITARMADGVETPLSMGPWPGVYPRPELAWLPNGTGLVAVIQDDATGLRQIYQIDYPSGAVKRITNDLASYSNLSVTGDGSSLVTIKDDTTPQIWVLDPKDPETARQVTFGDPGYRYPSWTSDGALLASSQGLWLIDPRNGRKQAIPGTTGSDTAPVLAPDGRRVFFASRRHNAYAVWRVGRDGGGLTRLTYGDEGGRPKVSPDGRWLVYSGFAPDGIAIWKMPVEGGPPVRVNWGEPATEPDISPDGKWISGTARLGRFLAVVYPFEGGPHVKQFDVLPVTTHEHLAWAPDGKALTFIRNQGSVSNLWRQPLDGREPTMVTHFESQQIMDFAWARDGRLAVARAQREADVVVLRHFQQ
ncbi:MAG TPA: winged helix-turn-helix domain-containing protein [Bryobacteraceae bacterium]|nr:winged helix-turn-helix domain-containing protein [Bryobacteraceae bacterium]